MDRSAAIADIRHCIAVASQSQPDWREVWEDALKSLTEAPMEAVAWRYPVLTARDEAVARMARAMRNGKAWPAVFQANTAEALAEDALAALEALAVIPTEGGGRD